MELFFKKNLDLGNYSMSTEKGRVLLSFSGFHTGEGFDEFAVNYNKIKSSIDVSKTVLVIDSSEVNVFPKEVEAGLGEFYLDYTKFKKVYIINGDNKRMMAQLTRMWRKHNIVDKFFFINSLSEAI